MHIRVALTTIIAVLLVCSSVTASETSPITALAQKAKTEGPFDAEPAGKSYYYVIDIEQNVLRISKFEKPKGSKKLIAYFWDTGPDGPNGSVNLGHITGEPGTYYSMIGAETGAEFASDRQEDYTDALREVFVYMQTTERPFP